MDGVVFSFYFRLFLKKVWVLVMFGMVSVIMVICWFIVCFFDSE